MILILSDAILDAHVEAVAAKLSERGQVYRIYNPARYPNTSSLTLEYNQTGFITTLNWDGYCLDVSKVTSVWFRRPGDYQISPDLRAEEKDWLHSECDHLFRGLYANMKALWVSEPRNIRQASLKLHQLRIATELGFSVPRFIVTNDVDQARTFLTSAKVGAVVKVLGRPALFSQKKAATLYTHLITEEDQIRLDSVIFGPTFLQEFVKKKMDVRVTVIGDRLFAAGIDSQEFEAGQVDFRRAEIFDLPHQRLELPEDIKTACFELVRQLGLSFGAIDLLLTPEGDYKFLEINPNGQWLWIEWVTGMPLTEAMCDLLSLPPTQ